MVEITHDNDMISALRKGDDRALTRIYKKFKPEFIQWSVREYQLNDVEAIELYQLSMVIFYDNVMTGKLNQFTSQTKTYIYGIAKNKARELLRRKEKKMSLAELVVEYVDDDEIEQKKLMESRLERVRRAMTNLGKKCQDIISLFYYKKMDMESIAKLMNYGTTATAKNMKYKCLKQLRKLINI